MDWDFQDWLGDVEEGLWTLLSEDIDDISEDELRDLYDGGYSADAAVQKIYQTYYEEE